MFHPSSQKSVRKQMPQQLDDFTLSRQKPIKDQSNISVFCRIEPTKQQQKDSLSLNCSQSQGKTLLSISEVPNKIPDKSYCFTRVFRNEPQNQAIKTICDPIVSNFNTQQQQDKRLIFSYGVTNSGKSYTILGTKQEPGVLYYVASKIPAPFFISPYEVYNNEYYCLLTRQKLAIKTSDRFEFEDYTPFEVTQYNLADVLARCIANRKESEQGSSSSHSHAVFKIQKQCLSLAIVDLAGSERDIGQYQNQQISINKSLLTVGKCLKALMNKEATLPVRENSLTRSLAEYFNRYSNIVMVVNINPIKSMLHQTIQVLQCANTAVTSQRYSAPTVMSSCEGSDIYAQKFRRPYSGIHEHTNHLQKNIKRMEQKCRKKRMNMSSQTERVIRPILKMRTVTFTGIEGYEEISKIEIEKNPEETGTEGNGQVKSSLFSKHPGVFEAPSPSIPLFTVENTSSSKKSKGKKSNTKKDTKQRLD